MKRLSIILLFLAMGLSAKAQVYRNGLINSLPGLINPAWTGYVFNHELEYYYDGANNDQALFDVSANAHAFLNHRSQWTGLPQTINGSTAMVDFYDRNHWGLGFYGSRQSAGTANIEEYYMAGLISYRLGGRQREQFKMMGGLQVGHGWSRLGNANALTFRDMFDLNGPTGLPTLDPVVLQFESVGYYNFGFGLAVAQDGFYGGLSIRNFASARSNRSLLNNFEDEQLPFLYNLQLGNTFKLGSKRGLGDNKSQTRFRYLDVQGVFYKQEDIPGYLQLQANLIAQRFSLGMLYSGTLSEITDNSVFGAMVGLKFGNYSFRYLYTNELTGTRSTNFGSTHEFGLAYLFRIGTGPCRGIPMRTKARPGAGSTGGRNRKPRN